MPLYQEILYELFHLEVAKYNHVQNELNQVINLLQSNYT